jgi:hypothetical protein
MVLPLVIPDPLKPVEEEEEVHHLNKEVKEKNLHVELQQGLPVFLLFLFQVLL